MTKKLELLIQLSKVNSIISRRLISHGLSFSDFIILHLINSSREKKLKRVELAELMGLTASGVTRMILPLEKLHILEKMDDATDARAKYAKLTKAGEELYKDANTWINLKIEDLLPDVKKNEINKILNIFYSIKNE
ncbi:MAG: winged helix DNA-binding protein [Patescibacteria group bacterium]|nr:winged helix DNA-binding protein [Patescibacteria group bacterium]